MREGRTVELKIVVNSGNKFVWPNTQLQKTQVTDTQTTDRTGSLLKLNSLKAVKLKNLVPRIQNSRFLLTSDHITTPL